MITVTKFGGSSVATAEQFKKVKGIIETPPNTENNQTLISKYANIFSHKAHIANNIGIHLRIINNHL